MHTKSTPPAAAPLLPDPQARPEETLDPADWGAFGALGHRIVDDVVRHLATVRERPVWRSVPGDVRARLAAPAPRGPEPLEAVYERFLRDVLPYPYGNTHPRFWGWVNGSGVPSAVLADFLASAMNPNVGSFDQSAVFVEAQVLEWLREGLGFPPGTKGVLTSGGSMANLLGLAAARSARAGFDVRRLGMGAAPAPMTLYGSTGVHSSVQKAVELLGWGSDALRRLPVDDERRLDPAALREAVRADRAAGRRPVAVVASAGTVDTGAIDDLDALADVCREEGLWLHVDGAIGAVAWLAEELRPRLSGLQRADSLAFDPHKWLYLPIDVGCVFVRDGERLEDAFSIEASYLSGMGGGLTAETGSDFKNRGLELTRPFRALKVWFALREHGLDKLGRMIAQNAGQARYLGERVAGHPRLRLAAPVPLNVVAFRYDPGGAPPGDLDALNRRLLVRLQESGAAVPSHTVIDGAFCLRVAITNHRSRREDFDFLVDEVARLGDELAGERRRTQETKP